MRRFLVESESKEMFDCSRLKSFLKTVTTVIVTTVMFSVGALHAARCSEGSSQRCENRDEELQNLFPSFLFHCHNLLVFKGLMIE